MKYFSVIISFIFLSSQAIYAAVVDAPIEQKIVELHMTRRTPEKPEDAKKRKKILEPLPYSDYAVCSGSFIDAFGDILTARHCTDGFDSIEVVTFDQQHYVVTAVKQSQNHDISIIHIDRINTPHFKLAASITRGQTVYALGSPLGFTNTLSTGIVAKLDGDTTLIDCGVLPGNSGCPLIDAAGDLVGIVTAGYVVGMGVTHLNVAQSLDVVRFFLASLNK